MPCNSDYMNPNHIEIEMSKVCYLLDEIDGKKVKKEWWDGYHPNVYCKRLTKDDRDFLVSKLCSRLKKTDVRKYSLEMQMWWRDHQEADRKREKEEQAEAVEEVIKRQALAKLTPAERKALRLKN